MRQTDDFRHEQNDADPAGHDKKEDSVNPGDENSHADDHEVDETPSNRASSSDADIIAELEARVEKAENEAGEHYDRFLRASAELENVKKRTARDMEDFRKYANEALVKELLEVIDNLERAVATSAGDANANACIVEGVELTLKDILRVLEKFNVTPIRALGTPFDPAFHQAVMQEATDDCPENTVMRELQKGYMLNDRLIRPAMVVVAKAADSGENGGTNR